MFFFWRVSRLLLLNESTNQRSKTTPALTPIKRRTKEVTLTRII